MSSLDDVLQKAVDWPGTEKLLQVQDILNRNKLLIAQIHHNHEARTAESLQRNVALIRELNTNIAKVVQSYQELSVHIDAPGQNTSAM